MVQFAGEEQKCFENVELIQRLSKQFPGDVGIFMVYFLNHIKLNPGEAIYLAECEPHAYICGGKLTWSSSILMIFNKII